MAIEKPTLAQVLQDLLREKRISVSELARQASLPQPTIQRIVSGTHSRPHQKTLKTLANYFGITQDQLRGNDIIPWLSAKRKASLSQIPIIDIYQTSDYLLSIEKNTQSIVVDLNVSSDGYAIKMPDPSMEPLIPQGAILIVDPHKKPHYRSFVIVKIKNHKVAIVRQLIIDANKYYIKPLSPDLEKFQMTSLQPEDKILGVIVQVRFNCDAEN